jgi:hypothetical protein
MYRPVITVQQIFYNEYINVKLLKPIGINTWLIYLSINEKPNMSQLYSFIFHYLEENNLNIFRWKLLQYRIPTTKLLMKWRIAFNSQCNFCGKVKTIYITLFLVPI